MGGGGGMLLGSHPPSLSQAACPAMGHPPDLPIGRTWGGTRAGHAGTACSLCVHKAIMAGVGTAGIPSPGGHPLWLRAYWVSQVFMPRGGARHQASTGRWGASMVLALAGGSDGTRHKHLEHTCIHVCVPHRHSMGTHVAYVGMHICTVRRGCADSELVCSPPCTPPPCGPTGGCGCPSGWPGIAYKAGHSHKQYGHSPVLLPAPQWGRRLGST